MRLRDGSLCCRAIFVLAALPLTFISVAGCRAREKSFASPKDAAHAVENCTDDTCSQLTALLHLSLPLRPKVCVVRALEGTFERDSTDALLNVKCSQDFELILLTRNSRGRWQCTNSLPFAFGAHDVVIAKLQQLIDRSEDDIVTHGDTVTFGTGIDQADFIVVRVSGRKFHTVLDTVEKGTVAVEADQSVVEQQSSFHVFPATANGPGSVTETMMLQVGGRKAVVQREFNWQKDLRIFEPGLWYSPDASVEGKAKKKSG